ncbi:flagellar basal-body rod protein FlgF [Rhizosaccharibacter radicis]|uniref:Flagellar basal-body rod protein FlgF n=1 Tax=Rhizosaccharibacter radicis TaxID=2782605 RepID=A0ABT1W197_9PROT|nr:flagellar basal-body rod protein FlgF [Acetobacteraceae bacterium KSS12]
MENPTYIALSRLDTQQRTMDVIANNIANANTAGFRASRTVFNDYLSQQHGVQAPPGAKTLSYTQDRATYLDRTEGSFTKTDNPLDMAIGGDGFFTVQTPNGMRLTRCGEFGLLADGRIADSAGNLLLDNAGSPMQVAPGDTDIRLAADGTMTTENGRVGTVGVVTVADSNRLVAEGGKMFRADTDTTAAAAPKLVQGMIENSNVQPMTELTRMLQTQRDFQFVSQFVDSEAERQQGAIDKLTQSAGA